MINFNPSIDELSHGQYNVEWTYLSISKCQLFSRWSLEMDKKYHPTIYIGGNYLSLLELKLIQYDPFPSNNSCQSLIVHISSTTSAPYRSRENGN